MGLRRVEVRLGRLIPNFLVTPVHVFDSSDEGFEEGGACMMRKWAMNPPSSLYVEGWSDCFGEIVMSPSMVASHMIPAYARACEAIQISAGDALL